MTITFSRRLLFPLICCVFATPLKCALSPAGAQSAAMVVDGEPITEDDIEQRTRLNFLSSHKPSARQDVIDQLIDDRKKIREVAKYGVDPRSADVENAYAELCVRMRITPEQLAKSLEGRGIRVDALKQRIKADIARATLVRLHH